MQLDVILTRDQAIEYYFTLLATTCMMEPDDTVAEQPPLADTHDSVCTTYEAIRQIIQERKLQMAGPIN